MKRAMVLMTVVALGATALAQDKAGVAPAFGVVEAVDAAKGTITVKATMTKPVVETAMRTVTGIRAEAGP